MFVKTEVEGFSWLKYNCWGGAIDTLNTIEEHNKEDELMDYLEEIWFESAFEIPTLTELNDFLWFDDETIFEGLGIGEDDEDEDEDEFWEDDEDEEDEE